MDNIYTYEVNHGEDKPSVCHGKEINNGKLVSVCFDAQLSNKCKAHELLDDIFDNEELDHIVYKKLQAVQRLI